MINSKELREMLKDYSRPNLFCIGFELKPSKLALYIAAMSNTMDGHILIGVAKEEMQYHLMNISTTFNMNALMNRAIEMLSIKPKIDYGFINLDGKNILAIKVIKNDKAVLCDNNLYVIEKDEIVRIEGGRIMDKTKVFIVHGHDNEAKQETARFIEKLGFEAIILHEQASKGQTIIEKIEENSNVGFAVVLYTPCDEGKAKKESDLKDRARQNVIFEHGYLIGKIGRRNVCALVKGEVEKPNDISGVVYINMDSSGAWRRDLAKEMKESDYAINPERLIDAL